MGWLFSKATRDDAKPLKTAAAQTSTKSGPTHKKGEVSQKCRESTPKAVKTRSCLACSDDLPADEMMRLACGHYYCSPCTARLFTLATAQESSYPPKCCKPISLSEARDYLDRDTRKLYEKKRVEWNTKNRVYCSRKNCNAFIPPDNIDKRRAKCPECKKNTCPNCKEPEHRWNMCSENEALMATLETLERKGWQRCPQCGEGIEKIAGCLHMQCDCGCEFCYGCGKAKDGQSHRCDCINIFAGPLAGLNRPAGAVEDFAMRVNNRRFPNTGLGGFRQPLAAPGYGSQTEAQIQLMNAIRTNPMNAPGIIQRPAALVPPPYGMMYPIPPNGFDPRTGWMGGGGSAQNTWPFNPAANQMYPQAPGM